MEDPIYQFAYSPSGNVDLAITNDGEIDITGVAAGTGANGIGQVQIQIR